MSNIIELYYPSGKKRYINLDQFQVIDENKSSYSLMVIEYDRDGDPSGWFPVETFSKKDYPDIYEQITTYIKARTKIISS